MALLDWNLKEQMEVRQRVKNQVLAMRIAFGRAKVGKSFESQDDFNDFINIVAF